MPSRGTGTDFDGILAMYTSDPEGSRTALQEAVDKAVKEAVKEAVDKAMKEIRQEAEDAIREAEAATREAEAATREAEAARAVAEQAMDGLKKHGWYVWSLSNRCIITHLRTCHFLF
jgi:ElaB/YqjD/DUF883 family membrane-anchored ribosome-binding protein